MTQQILPRELRIDGAMWLIHGYKNLVVLAGHQLLEGFGVEVEVVLVGHSHRDDSDLRQLIEHLLLTQVECVLYRGRGHTHTGIASKVTQHNFLDCLPGLQEIHALNVRVLPRTLHHCAEDAIVLIGQRAIFIVNEVDKR